MPATSVKLILTLV